MDLFYISDSAVLESLIHDQGCLDSKLNYFSWDAEVCFYLESRGCQYINGWSFLEPEHIARNWNLAHTISEAWLRCPNTLDNLFGFNPLSCASQDLVYPIQAALNSRSIFEKLVSQHSVESFVGVANAQVGVLRTGPSPAHIAVNSVAESVFLYMCKKNGIETSIQRRGVSYSNSLNNSPLLGKLLADSYVSGRSGFDSLAIVFRDGLPYSEYYRLVNHINAQSGWRSITLNRDSLLANPTEDSGYGSIRAEIDRVEAQWLSDSVLLCNDFPELFQNPYLKFQFSRVKQELTNAIIAAVKFDAILEKTGCTAVYFGHEAFTFERMLCRVANQRGINTISLVHGGAGYKLGYRGLVGESKKILVWNSIDSESLNSYGVSNDRIKLSRSFREALPKEDATLASRRQSKRPLVTILTTAINCGLAAPIANPAQHLIAIEEMCRLIEQRPDLDFTIRAHPNYDYYSVYKSIYERGYKNLLFFDGETTPVIIDRSILCIMPNYYSSASIECFKLGVPVVYFCKSIYPLSDWSSCYDVVSPKIPTVASYDEMYSVVEKLISNLIFREKSVEDGRDILKQIFPDDLKYEVVNASNANEFSPVRQADGLSGRTEVPWVAQLRVIGRYWCTGAVNDQMAKIPMVFSWKTYFSKKAHVHAYLFGLFQSNKVSIKIVLLGLVFCFFVQSRNPLAASLKRAALDYLVLVFGSRVKAVSSFLRIINVRSHLDHKL